MTKKKRPQEYSPEEFDQVVTLLTTDASLRANIEAITGQTLSDKSPREIFNLYRAVDVAADVQLVVARYGRAKGLVREVRAELAADEAAHIADNPDVNELARRRISELEARCDELKTERDRYRQTNQALTAGKPAAPVAGRVIKGQVSA